jgi:CheY-like chemotaxis protein
MGKKILLADDSITIQKVIELTFSDEDFEVVTVSNGRQAVEKVQEVRPDLVLCDIIMPEKDGYEVCDFIKKNPATSQIPVLLLTGAFEPFDQERASRVGCDGFLAKPFEPQTLIAKVKELLNQAGARTTAPRPAAAPPPAPPTPAPAYSTPAPTPPSSVSPPPPAHYAPPSPAEAFVPEEPQDLYGAVDSEGEPMTSVTPEESATLRDSAAPAESDFSPWAQPTIEVPLETRAQASVESSQDEPLFEEVFEDEPAAKTAPPSPAATAHYSFGARREEDDPGTRAFSASQLPPPRSTAPIPPPPRAAAPAPPPPAPSNPGPSTSFSPTWSASPPSPPPASTAAPASTPAAPAGSFSDLAAPAAAAAASSIAGEVSVPKDMVETIAQRVVAQISEKVVREIAWEVIPDLAEALIKQEIERLKAELQRT